jgi:radical SAM protein with 4Fe4S-binding SPASM domain
LERYNILLNVKDLKEILNAPENFRTSTWILPKSCKSCPLLYFCGGGCPSEVINEVNYYCPIYKREYIEVMKRMPYFLKIL